MFFMLNGACSVCSLQLMDHLLVSLLGSNRFNTPAINRVCTFSFLPSFATISCCERQNTEKPRTPRGLWLSSAMPLPSFSRREIIKELDCFKLLTSLKMKHCSCLVCTQSIPHSRGVQNQDLVCQLHVGYLLRREGISVALSWPCLALQIF